MLWQIYRILEGICESMSPNPRYASRIQSLSYNSLYFTYRFDHHNSFIEYEVVDDVQTLYQYDNNQTMATQANADYTEVASPGVLGSPNGVSFAVYRAPDSVFDNVNSSFHTDLPADRGHLLIQCATVPLSGNATGNVVSGFVGLVQPEANGEMHLASNDFRDDPIINSNYWGSASMYTLSHLTFVVK